MTAVSDWELIADADELASGERKSVFIDDTPALLVRLGDQYFAVEDVCTHDGQPLTDGALENQSIVCPRHGARFDLASGKALCMPATSPVRTFAVEVRSEGVFASSAAASVASPASTSTEKTTAASAVPAPAATSLAVGETLAAEGSAAEGSATEASATEASAAVAATSSTANDGDEASDLEIIDALRQVIDPELMVNIVDLGLVYSINHADRKAVVEMTLTSPACPAGPQIVQQAKMVVERMPTIDEAQIKLTMSPPWTPDRMTDEARDQLGFF